MSTPPNPLPPNIYPDGPSKDAYDLCLKLESNSPPGSQRLIFARFLGHMIREAPTPLGRDNVSREIAGCVDEDHLERLAKLYILHLVRSFRNRKRGRTPSSSSSDHPSSSSFTNLQQSLPDSLHEASLSHAKAKEMALKRDGYKCVISGVYDTDSCLKDAKVDELSRGKPWSSTHLAHILPESSNAGVSDKGSDKAKFAATVWTILQRFGQLSHEGLDGSQIHRMENVITLSETIHTQFDNLRLWLEETATPNTYDVKAIRQPILMGIPDSVTFTTPDPVKYPLPDPAALSLHAACARVAHLSGAAEYIETVLRDMEDICVLASDGSSAHVLELSLMNHGIVTCH